jgi:hypothetical protein
VRAAPRWACSDQSQATVIARYGASDGYFAYRWRNDSSAQRIVVDFTGSGATVRFHLLMPSGCEPAAAASDSQPVRFETLAVEGSSYAAFALPMAVGNVAVTYGKREAKP